MSLSYVRSESRRRTRANLPLHLPRAAVTPGPRSPSPSPWAADGRGVRTRLERPKLPDRLSSVFPAPPSIQIVQASGTRRGAGTAAGDRRSSCRRRRPDHGGRLAGHHHFVTFTTAGRSSSVRRHPVPRATAAAGFLPGLSRLVLQATISGSLGWTTSVSSPGPRDQDIPFESLGSTIAAGRAIAAGTGPRTQPASRCPPATRSRKV
jgi:hypothetical protein